MKLISYEQFAKLRLRDFVPDSTAIGETSDWEWMGSVWHNEGIGFTSFSRHVSTTDETGGLEIYFSELPADCIQRVLTAIGLFPTVATGVTWRLGSAWRLGSVLYFIVPAGYFSRMARPLRLEFAGSLYHVTSRGDHREKIYLDDEDRRTFLDLLGKEILQQHWLCYAYRLMDNHYHVLIETPEPNLVRGMRRLNGVYTQSLNRRHGRVGHVFQGRYKAILVDKENYLLELCRYIVLNPTPARWLAADKVVRLFPAGGRATGGLSSRESLKDRYGSI